MNFRRVLRALREEQELRTILEAQPGESLIDAAKRLKERVNSPRKTKKTKESAQ